MLLDTLYLSGKITIRFGGDHQIIGSSLSYQGKIPFSYARSNRGIDKSPPTATIPSGEALSTGGKYKSLDKKYMV
jgi:hypothetical protein